MVMTSLHLLDVQNNSACSNMDFVPPHRKAGVGGLSIFGGIYTPVSLRNLQFLTDQVLLCITGIINGIKIESVDLTAHS